MTHAVDPPTPQLDAVCGHRGRKRVFFVVATIAMATLIIDVGTKELVRQSMSLHQRIEVIPGLLNLHFIKNPGAAFGLGDTWPEAVRYPFFLIVFAVAAWVLFSFYQRCRPHQTWLKISLGLVAGGAVGNFADRIVHRKVTDFIDIYYGSYHWPFFNAADIAITVGVAILFIHLWFFEEEKRGEVERGNPILSQQTPESS